MVKVINYEYIHRKYPDRNWEFKAISVRIRDDGELRDVVYGTGIDNGVGFISVEIYTGANYIVGSSSRSYSRRYNLQNIPKKYQSVVSYASDIHRKHNWSNAEYINQN